MELVDHVHHVLYDNFVVVFLVANVVQQRLVELDDVDVQILEGVESRVTCTEIVNRNRNPVLAKNIDELLHGNFVFVVRSFGELDFDVLAVDSVLGHDTQDIFGEIRVAQVELRKIGGHADGVESRV